MESHKGAETIPGLASAGETPWHKEARTILDQDVEALLDEEAGVKDDEAEAEGKDVVGGADLEECTNAALRGQIPVSIGVAVMEVVRRRGEARYGA